MKVYCQSLENSNKRVIQKQPDLFVNQTMHTVKVIDKSDY